MKIAIISSYREACGPAAYTKFLERILRDLGHTVVICKLDVKLLRTNSSIASKAAIKHLQDLAMTAETCDKIFWQFEPGLLSSIPSVAYKRANGLLKRISASKTTITIHGFDRPSRVRLNLYGIVKHILQPKTTLRIFSNFQLSLSFAYFKFLRSLKSVRVFCFKNSDVEELRLFLGVDSTYLPISYLSKQEIITLKKSRNSKRASLVDYLNVEPTDHLICIAGFVSDYKNHSVALNALKLLPSNFKLVIAGGLHPHADDKSEYLDKLLSANYSEMYSRKFEGERGDVLFSQSLLDSRVFFLGNQSDEKLNDIIVACDLVLLPYFNTLSGQSGSGPLALTIELAKNSLISSADVFTSQDRLSNNDEFVFNSANHEELALKIANHKKTEDDFVEFVRVFREEYNAETQAITYMGSEQ